MASSVDIDDVVRALYSALLLRAADPQGLEAYSTAIASGDMSIEAAVAHLMRSAEFRRVAAKVLRADVSFDKAPLIRDHSQYGEFGLLLESWANQVARHRVVVDVGARGKERSNSYDLMQRLGWRGLLIEANPALIEPIRQQFAGLRFDLINIAISDFDGEATFHIGSNDDVSSLDAGVSSAWGDIRSSVQVQVRTLPPVLRENDIPADFDLLSLDIEGHDIAVLNHLVGDGSYRPGWIIIEASHEYNTKTLDDLALTDAVKAQYEIVGQTYANLILRRFA